MNKRVQVYASIGSNVDRDKHLRAGLRALRETFGEASDWQLSPVYETAAVGFVGDNFYNLAIGFTTEYDPHSVAELFKQIENRHGRDRSQPKFSPRTLDIDLLLYGELIRHDEQLDIPRDEISKYAFVLAPLADIAPELIHPEIHKTMRELWHEMSLVQSHSNDADGLTQIDFDWNVEDSAR